jgi:hypothetical protein
MFAGPPLRHGAILIPMSPIHLVLKIILPLHAARSHIWWFGLSGARHRLKPVMALSAGASEVHHAVPAIAERDPRRKWAKLWDLELWQIGHDSPDCTDYPAICPRLDFVNVAGGSILATGA